MKHVKKYNEGWFSTKKENKNNAEKISDMKKSFDILNQVLIQRLIKGYVTDFRNDLENLRDLSDKIRNSNWLTTEEKNDLLKYFHSKKQYIKNKANEAEILYMVEDDIDEYFDMFQD
jgi:hypothetical protein